ncbi:MAG: hypothetical protein QM820_40620 [Minicystis sp.]
MVSPTALWEAVGAVDALPAYRPPPPLQLDPGDVQAVLARLADRIELAAKRVAGLAQHNLELLSGAGIYGDLLDPPHRRAALVAELFRDARVARNAGYLDAAGLQRRIHRARSRAGGLTLELGWGQAKRDAGLLKTPGRGADLAELVAIARLGVIVRASQHILEEPVTLRVITGGRRFFEALFTCPTLDAAYNAQRAALAAAIGLGGAITFADIDRYWSEGEIAARLDRALLDHPPASLPGAFAEASFQFVLFNIDWYNILGGPGAGQPLRPHGLPPPAAFLEQFSHLGPAGRSLLLRHLLAAVVNPDLRLPPVEALGCHRDSFEAARSWATGVTAVSARKYELLGALTTRAPVGDGEEVGGAVALTVVEKPSTPAIPELALLGRRAGATLPQHVVPVLGAERTLGFHFYLRVVNQFAPLYLSDDTPLLPWLEPSGQPLCLAVGGIEEARCVLLQCDMFDGA